MKKLLLLCLFAGIAHAQPYPSKPVRLIIPFPPGGSNDIVGRMVATQLGERLGQSVIADNRGGAGGTIGTDMAAKSAPDGYTLLLISVAHAFNPAMYKKLPYDPEKSFAPIGLVAAGPVALMVNPSVPAHSVKELIDLIKANPGKLNYATAGIGSFQHLASELFKLQTGVDMVHVPYKGGGPAMMDTIGGQAQINMASLIQVIPHVKSGKLRLLATSGAKRSALFPDVPTVAETVPGFEASTWQGIGAPKGTPAEIVDKLNKEINAALADPKIKDRLDNLGSIPTPLSPAAYAKLIADDTEKWGKVVRAANMKAE